MCRTLRLGVAPRSTPDFRAGRLRIDARDQPRPHDRSRPEHAEPRAARGWGPAVPAVALRRAGHREPDHFVGPPRRCRFRCSTSRRTTTRGAASIRSPATTGPRRRAGSCSPRSISTGPRATWSPRCRTLARRRRRRASRREVPPPRPGSERPRPRRADHRGIRRSLPRPIRGRPGGGCHRRHHVRRSGGPLEPGQRRAGHLRPYRPATGPVLHLPAARGDRRGGASRRGRGLARGSLSAPPPRHRMADARRAWLAVARAPTVSDPTPMPTWSCPPVRETPASSP